MASTEPQTIQFDLTWGDLRRFLSYHTWHEPTTRVILVIVYVGWIACVTHLVYTLDIGLPAGDPRVPTMLAAMAAFAALLAALAGIVWYYLFPSIMTFRVFRESVGGVGASRVTICPDGLLRSWPSGATRLDWSAIRGIVDTPRDIWFFLGRMHAIAIPRRSFTSAAAADAFVRAAREWQASPAPRAHGDRRSER